MKFTCYKPLAYTVSDSSVLVVPAISIPDNQVSAWAAGDYLVGNKAKYNGNSYMCIGAGTALAGEEPTATDGDQVKGAVTWRYIRPVRNQLIIINDSSEVIYLGFGVAAEANKGVRLSANGGTFNATQALAYVPTCDIYAIAASSGSHNLCIQEL